VGINSECSTLWISTGLATFNSNVLDSALARRLGLEPGGITSVCRASRSTPAPVMHCFKAQSGALGLAIIRQYRDEPGGLIAVSESVYPTDRFTLTMQMKRDKV